MSIKMGEPQQWAAHQGKYMPTGATVDTLPAGMYAIQATHSGLYLEKRELETDALVVVAESPVFQIIDNIDRFWKRRGMFETLGLVHKRGVLLYGGPGCGKSATAELLAQAIIENDGIVLQGSSPDAIGDAIRMIRGVEPTARIAVILEDIDQSMDGDSYGQESELGNLLDGVNQLSNVIYIATTNHLDKIPERFKNRPSRFDEVVEIALPGESLRLAFLQAKIPSTVSIVGEGLIQWAADTEGFSLAHLRELIVGVLALGRPYEEVLGRLRKMVGAGDIPEVAAVANEATDETPIETLKANIAYYKKAMSDGVK